MTGEPGLVFGFTNFLDLRSRNQLLGEKHVECTVQLTVSRAAASRDFIRQVVAHFFAHEHAVRADVDDATLSEQTVHQRLDLRIDERFAPAN